MNCREFRRKHDAYIDDTLSGDELEAMTNHRRLCERCATVDTRVRRALLVAHNLPMIHPSQAFGERLQARLAQERALMAMRRAHETGVTQGRWRPFSTGAYTAIAAGLMLAAGLATLGALHAWQTPDTIRLAPVVASRQEATPSSLAPSTMVASMPGGMTIWPAVFVAQQAPWHLADDIGR